MPGLMPLPPPPLLLGANPVVAALRLRLMAQVPAELAALEDLYGRPVPPIVDPVAEGADLWRDPQLYAASDRALLQPDDYPAILVVPQSTGDAQVLDWVGGTPVWQIPYVVRIWAFVRQWGHEEVAACRDRLAVGVLQAIFRHPRLDADRVVRPSGWRTSYSDVGVDTDDLSAFAGWWLELIVDQTEQIGLEQLAPTGDDGLSPVVQVAHPAADYDA